MPLMLKLLRPIFSYTVTLLRKFQARTGVLPLKYFYLASVLVPSAAIELLVLRKKGETWEVFLSQREATDPCWPSQWHHPGTILRNGDSFEKACSRIAKELKVSALPSVPRLFDLIVTNHVRGTQSNAIYILTVPAETSFETGQFFDLKHLPDGTIDFQRTYLESVDTGKISE